MTITYTAWNTVANAGKAGDGVNHTLRWIKDGAAAALADPQIAEVDPTNAPGEYKVSIAAAEADCNLGKLAGRSSTAGVVIIPVLIQFERLPDAAPGMVGGLPTVNSSNQVKADMEAVNGQPASLSSTPVTANVIQVEGQALSPKVGDNFNAFFRNGGADTTRVVDNVGTGGEGGGSTPAQIWDHPLSAITQDSSVGKLIKDHLDIAISTRSTYAGGAVASVTAPVTVGVNNDKVGYTLGSAGLDGITVEVAAGGVGAINARQALALVMDAVGSGQISGAATDTVVVKNPGGTATRMTVSVDSDGNRTGIMLAPPI